MAKAYWVNCIRAVHDDEKLVEYARLAKPAIERHGGRFLARAHPSRVYEAGLEQRTVIIEFDSVEQAVAAYESEEYRAALDVLGDAAERDLRIVEGVP